MEGIWTGLRCPQHPADSALFAHTAADAGSEGTTECGENAEMRKECVCFFVRTYVIT